MQEVLKYRIRAVLNLPLIHLKTLDEFSIISKFPALILGSTTSTIRFKLLRILL